MITIQLLTLSSISQTLSDSVTCLPNSKLRKVIKEIENCKITKEELQVAKNGIAILEERVKTKDSIIKKYEVTDSAYKKRCDNYDDMVVNLKDQLGNEKLSNSVLNLKVSALKLNKWIFAGAGILVGILIKSL